MEPNTPSSGGTYRVYVGNLDHKLTELELMNLLAQFGPVKSLNIVKDGFTGNSRGYAFVEMTEAGHAMRAISELKGKDLAGRRLALWALF
jgi:RNA recognition motif-containing protein